MKKVMKYLEAFGNYGSIADTIEDKKDLERNVGSSFEEVRQAMEDATSSIVNLTDAIGVLDRTYGGAEDNLKLNWIGDQAETEGIVEELEYLEEDLKDAADKIYQIIHTLRDNHDKYRSIRKKK